MRKLLFASLILATISSLAQAHHSYAMFDTTMVSTIQGSVRSLEWSSPHVWLWVDVSDAQGNVTTYGFESVSPAQLQRDYGWSHSIVRPGDKVKVQYAPLRSGKAGGELEKMTLANGKVLGTRTIGPGPEGAVPSGSASAGNADPPPSGPGP
jgi:hypothetical protein